MSAFVGPSVCYHLAKNDQTEDQKHIFNFVWPNNYYLLCTKGAPMQDLTDVPITDTRQQI